MTVTCTGCVPGPLERCPACRERPLEAVSDGTATNFFCAACVSCWHVELGFVHRVDASTCSGCDHLPVCILKLALATAQGE